SRPARPVPDTGKVHGFAVWKAKRQSVMTSFMIRVNSGSNWPSRGVASARSTRGSAMLGPGPSRMRGPGSRSPRLSILGEPTRRRGELPQLAEAVDDGGTLPVRPARQLGARRRGGLSEADARVGGR